jgi:hypothetical protein
VKPESVMPTLAEWQQSVAAVCEGHDAGFSALQGQVLTEPDCALGLDVYRNNFLGARLAALLQTFPRLLSLLGENYLQQCGRRFLADFPLDATTHDMNQLGKQFPTFLRGLQIAKDELAPYPWLADLASLEYARHAAYYAADDGTFDFEAFQGLENLGEDIYFQTSKSLMVIECEWPLLQVDCDIASGAILEHYPLERQVICVCRENFSINTTQINEAACVLFKGLFRDLPMVALLEQSGEGASYLPLIIQRGWICGFKQKSHANDI